MAETIKELFRHRARCAWTAVGLGYAVAIPALSWAWFVGGSDYTAAAAVVGTAAVFGGMLYLDRTRCPKCHKRLGFHDVNPYRLARGRPAFKHCPKCGVSLDEPCEAPGPIH